MRKILLLAALYTALAGLANARDYAALADLREGDMRKLLFHETPRDVSDAGFVTVDDAPLSLAEWEGKYVVLNFWATWCAPCRHEMPMLAELQAEFQGEAFEVLTIATGRNKVAGMRRFFAEIGVDNLPLHRDPKQALAREMGVLGLPVTLILNPKGEEIARMQGDATWNSDSAKAIVSALLADS
ncbi:MAG: TlpA disulfide reductase family protein [Pseudomonadota bacterium]